MNPTLKEAVEMTNIISHKTVTLAPIGEAEARVNTEVAVKKPSRTKPYFDSMESFLKHYLGLLITKAFPCERWNPNPIRHDWLEWQEANDQKIMDDIYIVAREIKVKHRSFGTGVPVQDAIFEVRFGEGEELIAEFLLEGKTPNEPLLSGTWWVQKIRYRPYFDRRDGNFLVFIPHRKNCVVQSLLSEELGNTDLPT